MQFIKSQAARAVFICFFFGAFFSMGEFRAWLVAHGVDEGAQMWIAASMMLLPLAILGVVYLWLANRKGASNCSDLGS